MKKHLAQLNISRIIPETMENPIMNDFVAQLDTINALAESSKGFIWRLKGDDNNATNFRPFDDDRVIVNMSVWESAEGLMEFVYKSAHTMVMKDRNKWFENMESLQPYFGTLKKDTFQLFKKPVNDWNIFKQTEQRILPLILKIGFSATNKLDHR